MPTPEQDPYAVLGVTRNATPDEIKAAYRERVAKYHPDRHQGNPLEELAAAKLAEINRAYEILSDPERRTAYDRGQPVYPRPVASPFDNMSFGGSRKKRPGWLYVLGLILLLPLLIRLAVVVARLLAGLFRVGLRGLVAARGTPFALTALAIVLAMAIWLFLRRRRRK
jgi:curved DNA-binding protein CbpA